MVSSDEAALIFRKWADENTPLLFRSHSPLYAHSMLCGLESAKEGAIRLRLQGLGHIDIHISSEFTFEYFDPAAQRDILGDGVAQSSLDSLATGAGMIASNAAGESFMFLEILFT